MELLHTATQFAKALLPQGCAHSLSFAVLFVTQQKRSCWTLLVSVAAPAQTYFPHPRGDHCLSLLKKTYQPTPSIPALLHEVRNSQLRSAQEAVAAEVAYLHDPRLLTDSYCRETLSLAGLIRSARWLPPFPLAQCWRCSKSCIIT